MTTLSATNGAASRALGPDSIERLNALLEEVWASNAFYREKWRAAGLEPRVIASLDELEAYPFTHRSEILADQERHPPFGSNLSRPAGEYLRVHASSGSSGRHLVWPDTRESWAWLVERSAALFRRAGVDATDRVYCASGLGATLGPWVVFEGALAVGCRTIPRGSAAPREELCWFLHSGATVVVGKPSGFLRLGRSAVQAGLDPAKLGVRALISSGDPGERARAIRRQAAELWGTDVLDRYGLTEAGSVAAQCAASSRAPSEGMHLEENGFIAEVVDLETGGPVPDGGEGELVLTTLGRRASPIVRYRTGDLVRVERRRACPCGADGAVLVGGIRRKNAIRSIKDLLTN